MKVLFLDIDGVLNDTAWLRYTATHCSGKSLEDSGYWSYMVNPASVQLLNLLLDETGAAVVVSSSWRRSISLETLRHILTSRGLKHKVLDVLPLEDDLNVEFRGEVIQKWLDKHPEVTHHVCLDDDIDEFMTSYVKTSAYEGGFTLVKYQEALKLFLT